MRFDNVMTHRLYEAGTPLRGERRLRKTGNHTKPKLSTRHFYFAETPTFLLCVDMDT